MEATLFEKEESFRDQIVPYLNCFHQKQGFFKDSEKKFYRNLYCLLNEPKASRYHIFCNTRFGDIFDIYCNEIGEKKSVMDKKIRNMIGKLQMDFVICDGKNDFKPILAIELDGYSHQLNKKYDIWKDNIMTHIGIPLIRFDTNFLTPNEIQIRNKLEPYLGKLKGFYYDTKK